MSVPRRHDGIQKNKAASGPVSSSSESKPDSKDDELFLSGYSNARKTVRRESKKSNRRVTTTNIKSQEMVKVREKLSNFLKKIADKKHPIDEKEETLYVSATKQLVEGCILPSMKRNNALFALMFRNEHIYWTGSMFNGLRVGEATEFDVNVILEMPDGVRLELQQEENTPQNYAFVNVLKSDIEIMQRKSDSGCANYYCSPLDLMDQDDHIKPQLIKHWMRDLVHEALVEVNNDLDSHFVNITPVPDADDASVGISYTKPGVTLVAKLPNGVQLDIDIVFVFEFPASSWPTGVRCDQRIRDVPEEERTFFAVPKSKYNANSRSMWKLSFDRTERYLLREDYAKDVTKHLKLIFGTQERNAILNSYQVKNTVLWIISDNAEVTADIGTLFQKALLLLLNTFLKEKKMPNYWAVGEDLMRNLTSKQKSRLKHMIEEMLTACEAKPERLFPEVTTKEDSIKLHEERRKLRKSTRT